MRPPHSKRITFAILAVVLGAAACGGGGAGRPRPRGSADRITESELEAVYQLTAYEAIQRLRPRWLQTRTGDLPTVHVDGAVRSGGREVLASIRASDIQEIQYMNAPDATTRFGTNYISGVILVSTKR